MFIGVCGPPPPPLMLKSLSSCWLHIIVLKHFITSKPLSLPLIETHHLLCIKPLERDGVDVMLLGGDWEWCLQKAESFVIRDVKVFSGGWTRIAEEGRLEGASALALSSSSDDRSSNCLWKPKGSRSLSLMRLKRCLLRGNLYIGVFWRRYRMTFRHLRNCGESLRSSYSDEKTEEESTIDE
ncbi:hypothetical protein F2Q70_00038749 [Brassica cretica]|uniref:Uncharacterized protein n=1 Tax=Brassica cretica TaxID=69181 RepID=A0A8S9K9V6_BRACR|nr:hypothetical protein F2Q70_00038749 [Brassica cretica]KAF2619049.1 hypothetical protein F2Q68_00039414 [Brassica cretica]